MPKSRSLFALIKKYKSIILSTTYQIGTNDNLFTCPGYMNIALSVLLDVTVVNVDIQYTLTILIKMYVI